MFIILYRYELSGINGLNFVLRKSLGGGGVASIRNDPQVRFCYYGNLNFSN